MTRTKRAVPTAAEMDGWLDEAINAGAPALNLGLLGQAVNDAVAALANQAKALKAKEWTAAEGVVIARSMQYAAKVIDELSRLSAFAQGQPDSRPDQAGAWLGGLTDAQLAQVQGWLEGNGPR